MKIFITIGTAFSFDRLIKEIDNIKREDWDIIAQTGKSNYKFKNIKKHKSFFNIENMENIIKEADVVVSHAGIGSIVDLIKYKKKCVLVPRLKEFKEVVDDHQLEICKELEKEGTTICYDVKDIKNKIEEAKELNNLLNNLNFSKKLNSYILSINRGN